MNDVENSDYTAFAQRIIAAAGRRCGRGDVEMLDELRALHDHVDRAVRVAVRALHSQGYSDAEMASRIGVSRQRVFQIRCKESLDADNGRRHSGRRDTDDRKSQ